MRPILKTFTLFIAGLSIVAPRMAAQGTSTPLTLQGLDQTVITDVRSLGMGGAVTAAGNNASVLFSNPAGLAAVRNLEIRVSGGFGSMLQRQTQKWVPNRYFTGLSLMMEDSWGDIKSPMLNDTTPVTDPWEQLQKPFDTMGPNWSRHTSSASPLAIAAAFPIITGELTVVGGIGAALAADLTYYFQNNNVTDPLLGRYRPTPIPELQPTDTLRARWYRSTISREGEIWGITPAIGFSYGAFSGGFSATYLTGSSDDLETRLDRGFLTFLYNRFRVQDTVRYRSTTSGTSEYSGIGVTAGFRIAQPTYTIGVSFKLPFTLERKYTTAFSSVEEVVLVSQRYNPSRTSDSLRTTNVQSTVTGKDEIAYPLSYTIGVMLRPFERWTFAFDVESRRLNFAEVKKGNAPAVKPWLSAPSFSLGAEYIPETWIALRCGYYEASQVFEPEGAAIIGEPVMRSAYTLGTGITEGDITLDLAYEYSSLRYQDVWQSNINANSSYRHRVAAEVSIRL